MPQLRKALETAYEICKLIKKSPKRNTKIDELRNKAKNDSKSIQALCPTRWTVLGESLASILNNHAELMDLWNWSLGELTDTEMKARIQGAKAQMQTFSFFFCCSLASKVLKQTDNLSCTLQSSSMSAAQGNLNAQSVVKSLEKFRNEESLLAMTGQANRENRGI